ncbi:MAG: helix-turn-helix domain-containing protein [Coriobacteriales bacterium]|nr:helix-turn-helix domain-containing protein [Coriobacteriales bacterium]
MELNLHIIADDLAGYAPQVRIEEDYPVRRLRFPALFDGTETRRSLLYIVESSLLTPENIKLVTESSSLLVIGKPPRALFKLHCNIVWVPASVQLSKLFSEVAALFGAYNLWGEQMHDLLITKKRLKRLAEISLPIIRRPIHLVDSFLQVLFSVAEEDEHTLASRGHRFIIDNDDPALSVLTLDRFSESAYAHDEPFILARGEFLSQNIFISGHLVATLSFSQAGRPFSKRDYSLLLLMTDILKNGLTYMEEWNTSAPRAVDAMLQLLLASGQVQESVIDAALKTMAWHENDSYYCIVAVPTNPVYPSGLLTATAKRVAAQISQMIYTVYQNIIVFVINADQSTVAQDDILELMVAQLAHLETSIGVSNIFDGFHALKQHFELALAAQKMGTDADLASGTVHPYHRFEAHFMEFLIQTCSESVSLEAIIPRGLVQLNRYDRKYGTDLVHILAVFLRHDMRIASAARELYLHRNTLTSKVAQIRFLTRMDFENDPEVRLTLMVSLRMLGEL